MLILVRIPEDFQKSLIRQMIAPTRHQTTKRADSERLFGEAQHLHIMVLTDVILALAVRLLPAKAQAVEI